MSTAAGMRRAIGVAVPASLGYPVSVTIDPVGDAGPPGTITITDFVIR